MSIDIHKAVDDFLDRRAFDGYYATCQRYRAASHKSTKRTTALLVLSPQSHDIHLGSLDLEATTCIGDVSNV